jgi:hypothetical protein
LAGSCYNKPFFPASYGLPHLEGGGGTSGILLCQPVFLHPRTAALRCKHVTRGIRVIVSAELKCFAAYSKARQVLLKRLLHEILLLFLPDRNLCLFLFWSLIMSDGFFYVMVTQRAAPWFFIWLILNLPNFVWLNGRRWGYETVGLN